MPNLAALRAAVFTLSGKNLRGVGGGYPPPPVGAWVYPRRTYRFYIYTPAEGGGGGVRPFPRRLAPN